MSEPSLIRYGGTAAMLGGIVLMVDGLLGLVNKDAQYLDVIFIVALVLVLVGLAGLHALQRDSYGRIGRVGFYTVVIATLAQILGLAVLLAGSAALEWLIPIGSLAVLVGFVLYGVATLQARVLPRWYGLALIVCMPLSLPLAVYGTTLFGLILVVLGYVLWLRRDASTEQPSRVR